MDFHQRLQEAEAIGLDVPVQNEYPTFIERYFLSRYKIDTAQEDHCILIHSNGVCIVTLAWSHPVIRFQKKISKIDFQVSENTNRLKNTVKGKRKHGAQSLNPLSTLCVINCEDGTKYPVRSCVRGKLLEINESLLERPQLLVQKPSSEGYIAIVLPNKINSGKDRDDLMTHEEFQKLLDDRLKLDVKGESPRPEVSDQSTRV